MKHYAQVIEAEQFNGDVKALRDFVGDALYTTPADVHVINGGSNHWKLSLTDYVVKTATGFDVYKAAKFEDLFDEVLVEDIPVVAEIVNPIKEVTEKPKRSSRKLE